jgi:signal transduction histidine kinase
MSMKKIATILTVILITSATMAMASGSEDEVKNLVNSAVSYFQEKGQDYSIKAFNAIHGPFVRGPLYVFAGTMDGRLVAHPMNKTLLEKPVLDMKDSDGKPLFRNMIEIVKSQGEGWVDYMWPDPETKQPGHKRSYVKRIPSQDVWIGAGYYDK